jgi:hypothetical protein
MIKLIDILKEAKIEIGPCLYPGAFKPPTRGHFEAAQYLASQTNIIKVYVIISSVEKHGISAKDSLFIWREYLKDDPNPKIEIELSQEGSPMQDVYRFLEVNSNLNTVYVAAGIDPDEAVNFDGFQKRFGAKVKPLQLPQAKEGITSEKMLQDITSGDFQAFTNDVPVATYNKGGAKKIFDRLIKLIQ